MLNMIVPQSKDPDEDYTKICNLIYEHWTYCYILKFVSVKLKLVEDLRSVKCFHKESWYEIFLAGYHLLLITWEVDILNAFASSKGLFVNNQNSILGHLQNFFCGYKPLHH